MPSVSAIAATSLAVWFASHGWRTVEPWIARSDAMSSSAICDGPSSPIETPAWEPESENVARLIAAMRTKSYARERNAAKVDANGRQPTRLEADSRGDQLLLGDVHLEVPLGMRLREDLGERRVRDLAVERDDVRPRGAERRERVTVRLARRDLVAELVARQLERSARHSSGSVASRASRPRRGCCARRRARRSPRRGRRAACRASRSGPPRPRRPCPSACVR